MYLTPNMQRRSSGSPTIASAANLPAESVSMFVGLNQLKLLALGQVQELNATRPYELIEPGHHQTVVDRSIRPGHVTEGGSISPEHESRRIAKRSGYSFIVPRHRLDRFHSGHRPRPGLGAPGRSLYGSPRTTVERSPEPCGTTAPLKQIPQARPQSGSVSESCRFQDRGKAAGPVERRSDSIWIFYPRHEPDPIFRSQTRIRFRSSDTPASALARSEYSVSRLTTAMRDFRLAFK